MPRQPTEKRFVTPIPALYPERDALLDAVRVADRQDTLPALVYADWQDEHDQPEHAELIRVMCEFEAEAMQGREKKARRTELVARIRDLLKSRALRPMRDLKSNLLDYHHGIIDAVYIDIELDLPIGPVRDRNLCGPPEQLDLPSYAPFDKFHELVLRLPGNATSELLDALGNQPWLQRMNVFWPRGLLVEPGQLVTFANSPFLSGLRRFDVGLACIPIDDVVAIHLAQSAKNLHEIDLFDLERRVCARRSKKPSPEAYLDAITQIVSSPLAARFTSFGNASISL